MSAAEESFGAVSWPPATESSTLQRPQTLPHTVANTNKDPSWTTFDSPSPQGATTTEPTAPSTETNDTKPAGSDDFFTSSGASNLSQDLSFKSAESSFSADLFPALNSTAATEGALQPDTLNNSLTPAKSEKSSSAASQESETLSNASKAAMFGSPNLAFQSTPGNSESPTPVDTPADGTQGKTIAAALVVNLPEQKPDKPTLLELSRTVSQKAEPSSGLGAVVAGGDPFGAPVSPMTNANLSVTSQAPIDPFDTSAVLKPPVTGPYHASEPLCLFEPTAEYQNVAELRAANPHQTKSDMTVPVRSTPPVPGSLPPGESEDPPPPPPPPRPLAKSDSLRRQATVDIMEDLPPPIPQRPGSGGKGTVTLTRQATVQFPLTEDPEPPPPPPRPSADTKTADHAKPATPDPFALTLPHKSKSPRSVAAGIARPRPRPRSSQESKASFSDDSGHFGAEPPHSGSPASLSDQVTHNSPDLRTSRKTRTETNHSQTTGTEINQTATSTAVENSSSSTSRYSSSPHTAEVTDPFIDVDPFAEEKDPFSDMPDPFSSPMDPFSKDITDNSQLFATRAVTLSEGGSAASGSGDASDPFSPAIGMKSDPFSSISFTSASNVSSSSINATDDLSYSGSISLHMANGSLVSDTASVGSGDDSARQWPTPGAFDRGPPPKPATLPSNPPATTTVDSGPVGAQQGWTLFDTSPPHTTTTKPATTTITAKFQSSESDVDSVDGTATNSLAVVTQTKDGDSSSNSEIAEAFPEDPFNMASSLWGVSKVNNLKPKTIYTY